MFNQSFWDNIPQAVDQRGEIWATSFVCPLFANLVVVLDPTMASFCPQCGVSLMDGANFCSHCGTPIASPPSGLRRSLAASLCYLLGIVSGVLFLNLDPYRKDATIRFHAWQSIGFGGLWLVLSIVPQALFFLGYLLAFFIPVVHLGFLAVWVLLIVKTYHGEKFSLPILGEWADHRARAVYPSDADSA